MDGDKRRTFSIITFGCKLNQYESECIRHSLEEMNWTYRPFDEGADCYIINSCTVTGKSDSRCRNAVRRARRMKPGARIIVTGCYAETQPEALEVMDEVDLVLGNDEKERIPSIVEGVEGEPSGVERPSFGPIDEFLDHSRAFIKIQEGCNAGCAYCIIPRARGSSRSTPPDDVLEQVGRLARNGYREIVLTGIHIGRYGLDLEGGMDLAGLIELLLERTEGIRLRLSSIEINEVTDRLMDLVASNGRVAPHLHIPLQSGDDDVLSRMKRPYDTKIFADRIDRIVRANGDTALGTDVIVGFPGETDEMFRNTYRFVKEMPFTYLHVFSYSRRPGTEADLMPDQIDPETRRRRSRRLIRLGNRKRTAFSKGRIGTEELALVQGPPHETSRFSVALTGTYCEVLVPRDESEQHAMMPVRITHYSRGRLYGTTLVAGAGKAGCRGGER